MPRKPKDVMKYLKSRIAAAQLIYCCMEHILFCKEHIRIKWTLQVSYYYEKIEPGQKTATTWASFKSSPPDETTKPEEMVKVRTG
jgi:hypothetical protein